MRNHILVSGPAAWNTIVYLDRLPEPRPHMQFALEDFATVGGTSAGKALHLSGLGHEVSCFTVLGDDAASINLRAALGAAGVELSGTTVPGPSERHLNLMTQAGERVSLYLSTPEFRKPDVHQFRSLATGAAALVMDLSETSRALLPHATSSGVPIWTDIHDYDGESEFHEPFIQAASFVFMNADGIHRVRAVTTEVRDTNGAGDAFFAGFLDATLSGASTDGALAAAASQAVVALQSKHLHPAVETALP